MPPPPPLHLVVSKTLFAVKKSASHEGWVFPLPLFPSRPFRKERGLSLALQNGERETRTRGTRARAPLLECAQGNGLIEQVDLQLK